MGPFEDGWTKDDVIAVMERGKVEELLYVPIIIGMNAPDVGRIWAEDICASLANHPHFNVRGNAILGLGHIARTCRELTEEKAFPLIQAALHDAHEYVRGHAHEAARDVHLYLGIVIEGYNTADTESFLQAVEDVVRRHKPPQS